MLILGGSGFIGRNLVNKLCSLNKRVKVLSLGPNPFQSYDCLEYIQGSFLDKNVLSKALENVTTVFHMVSTSTPNSSNLDPVNDIETNLIGLIGLLELMREHNVLKIVFLSSGGTVYGEPTYTPIDINHSLKPICSYGVVKVAMENYLYMYKHLYGIKPIILRVANPYGPGQSATRGQGVIADFMGKIISGNTINVWGDGSSIRDYIYIDDLVALCLKAAQANIIGTFNVGSGIGISVNQIISSIELITGFQADVKYTNTRLFDVKSIVLDVYDTKKIFSWDIHYNLNQGVENYYQHLVSSNINGC